MSIRRITSQSLRLALPLLVICVAAQARDEKVIGVGTFVTDQAHVKPTFEKDDEKVVRDFARSNGVQFDSQMELPDCMMRDHLATAGASFDAYRDTNKWNGWMVYSRIPIPATDVSYGAAAPYHERFTQMAFLEAHYQLEGAAWRVLLVVPPLQLAAGASPLPLRVANASVGNHTLTNLKVEYVPGLPTFVELPGFAEALKQEGSNAAIKVSVVPVLPPDVAAQRVSVATTLPQLQRDFDTSVSELTAMIARNERKQCDVFSRDCRDGECR